MSKTEIDGRTKAALGLFDDAFICPDCGEMAFGKTLNRCNRCSLEKMMSDFKKFASACNDVLSEYEKFTSELEAERARQQQDNVNNNKKLNPKRLKFDCLMCKNAIVFQPNGESGAFACQNCKSQFSYAIKNKEITIKVIKKGRLLPARIKKLLAFFELSYPFEKDELKRNYHKLLNQYHPDKLQHMDKDIIVVTEQKTKEIIKNFNDLQDWLQKKP